MTCTCVQVWCTGLESQLRGTEFKASMGSEEAEQVCEEMFRKRRMRRSMGRKGREKKEMEGD